MYNISNISSEEELLQLRNDGKLSEDEYKELLAAIRKSPAKDADSSALWGKIQDSKHKQGKIAFYLMLGGIVLPIASFFICFAITGGGEGDVIFSICFLIAILIEIPAFVFGVISWTDNYGKATVITILAVAVLISLNWLRSNKDRVTYKKERLHRTTKMEPVQIARQGDMHKKTMKQGSVVTELKAFALDDMQGLITQSGVSIDKANSSDGNGSLRIEATEPITISLFDTGDIDIENARLIYQAQIRTQDVDKEALLEMWCHFPGKGDFFSRDPTPVWGTTAWTRQETIFFFKKGENPDNVRLNLTINGRGTVWIDDIRLLKAPMKF
jgi:hypothetical protein